MKKQDKLNLNPTNQVPRAIQEVADTMRRYGQIGFWLQIFIGVLASLATVVAVLSRVFNAEAAPGAALALFLSICGLVTLIVAIYFCFRYIGVARLLLNSNPAERPTKQDTLKEVRLGVFVNLFGLFLSIVGAQAITGATLTKTFTIPQGVGTFTVEQASRLVQPVDLLVIQATVTIISAHFAGLIISTWLLSRLSR